MGTLSHQLLPPSPPASLFLEFIGDPNTPAWKGYLLAVLMFLSACLQTLFEQQHMYRLKVLQMRLRTAVTGLVYRKVSPRGGAWPFLSFQPVPVHTQTSQPRRAMSLNSHLRPQAHSFITFLIVAHTALSPSWLFL